jgi:L-aminopeptidase/D-esterase-like protein
MGEAAAAAATDGPVREGAVGAGTGATVGKALGMSCAMKSGIGSATVELAGKYAGTRVSVLAAVNAYGDVREPGTWKIIAGTRRSPQSMEFADSALQIRQGGQRTQFRAEHTALVVVATNARLTKVEAKKLAEQAQLGVARTISPVNTMYDGDVTIALSLGSAVADVNALGVAAAEAVAEAILRAVRLAPTLGGVPGLAGQR